LCEFSELTLNRWNSWCVIWLNSIFWNIYQLVHELWYLLEGSFLLYNQWSSGNKVESYLSLRVRCNYFLLIILKNDFLVCLHYRIWIWEWSSVSNHYFRLYTDTPDSGSCSCNVDKYSIEIVNALEFFKLGTTLGTVFLQKEIL